MFAIWCCKPLVLFSYGWTVGFRRIQSLKYQRHTSSGCKDIRILKLAYCDWAAYLFK